MHRVECRIHGVWFWMPLVSHTATHAVIELSNGSHRELPIADEKQLRFMENAVNRRDI